MDFRVDAGIILSKISKCNKEIEILKVHNCWGSEKNQNLPSLPLCQILTRCAYLSSISLRGCKFISCKFFQLLFTRDDIFAKKRLRRKRKNTPLEFFGDFTPKQLRAFLLARRETRDVRVYLNVPPMLLHRVLRLFNDHFRLRLMIICVNLTE
ncbi:hypothetical protein CBL_03056 [Carabus blaptoides fortunei]